MRSLSSVLLSLSALLGSAHGQNWPSWFELPQEVEIDNVTEGGLNWGGHLEVINSHLVKTSFFITDGDVLFKLVKRVAGEDNYCIVDSRLDYMSADLEPLPVINEQNGLACKFFDANATQARTTGIKWRVTHDEDCKWDGVKCSPVSPEAKGLVTNSEGGPVAIVDFEIPVNVRVKNATFPDRWGGNLKMLSAQRIRTILFDSDADVPFQLSIDDDFCVVDSSLDPVSAVPYPNVFQQQGLQCTLSTVKRGRGSHVSLYSVAVNRTHAADCKWDGVQCANFISLLDTQ